MESGTQGVIFDIKHYAIHDGPGIRTTVFLKGCPLKCRWCANPESQAISPEILFDQDRCTLCGECIRACPGGNIREDGGRRMVDRQKCSGCGRCVEVCVNDAIELSGFSIDLPTLWEKIRDDRVFWERSGGGVTLSGGEPLLQQDFAGEFLDLCRRNGVHTAMETCGQVSETVFARILPLVNLVIMDLKLVDSDRHRTAAGVPNDLIIRNLATLLKSPKDVLVRMPLIPGINNAPGDLKAVGDFLGRARPGVRFELLPYHRLGKKKYEKLGQNFPLNTIAPPTEHQVREALDILSRYHLSLVEPATGGRP